MRIQDLVFVTQMSEKVIKVTTFCAWFPDDIWHICLPNLVLIKWIMLMVKEYEALIGFCKQLTTVAKRALYLVFTANIPECHYYSVRRLKPIQKLQPLLKTNRLCVILKHWFWCYSQVNIYFLLSLENE